MKKLYNRKGKVHPTPPVVSDHLLSFLPAAILTLTVALSPEDKEVLAYLISCSSYYFSNDKTTTTEGGADHPQCFTCNCFRCYMRYWVKWDSSVNRQLIHEIIDAFEDTLLNLNESKKKLKKNKREKRRKGKTVNMDKIKLLGLMDESNLVINNNVNEDLLSFTESTEVLVEEDVEDEEDDDNVEDEEDEFEKGSIRRFVSFVGERIWSVWG